MGDFPPGSFFFVFFVFVFYFFLFFLLWQTTGSQAKWPNTCKHGAKRGY